MYLSSPYAFNVVWISLFERVFGCGVKVDQFDFRECLQCIRMLDQAV